MLKQDGGKNVWQEAHQPPSGGCVLKQDGGKNVWQEAHQPPSGGCVLKQKYNSYQNHHHRTSRLQAAVC